MKKNVLKTESDFPNTIITRVELAAWYGISESGFYKRIKKAELCIEHRVLTLNDVREIIENLGVPPLIPLSWQHVFDK